LVVDILDPSSRKPIWRGQATGMLQKNNPPESKERNLARAAEKIFADFPPQ
jgi:hypothetical protein